MAMGSNPSSFGSFAAQKNLVLFLLAGQKKGLVAMIKDMQNAQFTLVPIKSETDITKLIENDPWRMDVLRAAATLNLPDWWIGASFLRNIIWDAIEGNESSSTRDVDLVYFDSKNINPQTDWAYDEHMKKNFPFADWEVRNQARMHYVNDFAPYTSTADGIAHWVETATCIAVKIEGDKLRYLFCHGTDDLFGLVARPIAQFRTPQLLPVFYGRIEKKQWREKWPHLRVENE